MQNRKRFSQMTTAELRRATEEYDREWTGRGLPGEPLSARDRGLHKRARGRPKIGKGAKVVPVSIERELLSRADLFAKRHHLKRSEMVAKGLQLVMAVGRK